MEKITNPPSREAILFNNNILRIKGEGKGLILRGTVRRYTEASGTGVNILRSGSFPTSVLRIEPRTSARFATALSTALLISDRSYKYRELFIIGNLIMDYARIIQQFKCLG